MPVDAGEHLPLITRVIKQLDLRGDEADEAFSVGLVAITEAAIKYDPSRGAPIAHWLARNIRWSLNEWRTSLRPVRQHAPMPEVVVSSRDTLTSRVEYMEAIACFEVLTDDEFTVMTRHLLGWSGNEIAEYMKISPGGVSKMRRRARLKLTELLQPGK